MGRKSDLLFNNSLDSLALYKFNIHSYRGHIALSVAIGNNSITRFSASCLVLNFQISFYSQLTNEDYA